MELSVIEAELKKIADELCAVRPGECLACYLDRTLTQLGCSDHMLTERWNAAQPRRVPRLKQWLKSQGGFCDCEVLINTFGTGKRSAIHQQLQCDKAFALYLEEVREYE